MKDIFVTRGEIIHDYSYADYKKLWRAIRDFDIYVRAFARKYAEEMGQQFQIVLPDIGLEEKGVSR